MTPFHIASFRLVLDFLQLVILTVITQCLLITVNIITAIIWERTKILTHSLQAMNLATSSFFVGETQRKEPFNPSLHTKTVSGNST